MNTKPTGSPQTCEGCGRRCANQGQLAIHLKRCKEAQRTSVGSPPEAPGKSATAEGGDHHPETSGPPRSDLPRLDDVCQAIQEGLRLETACDSLRVAVDPYYAAQRRVATGDNATEGDRQAVARLKQAEAVFQRDLQRRLSDPKDRNDLEAAKALQAMWKDAMTWKRKNLQLEYHSLALLDVVKKHVDRPTYKAILGDLCEMDGELAALALDAQLIGIE